MTIIGRKGKNKSDDNLKKPRDPNDLNENQEGPIDTEEALKMGANTLQNSADFRSMIGYTVSDIDLSKFDEDMNEVRHSQSLTYPCV